MLYFCTTHAQKPTHLALVGWYEPLSAKLHTPLSYGATGTLRAGTLYTCSDTSTKGSSWDPCSFAQIVPSTSHTHHVRAVTLALGSDSYLYAAGSSVVAAQPQGGLGAADSPALLSPDMQVAARARSIRTYRLSSITPSLFHTLRNAALGLPGRARCFAPSRTHPV